MELFLLDYRNTPVEVLEYTSSELLNVDKQTI